MRFSKCSLLFFGLFSTFSNGAYQTNAKQALLLDLNSGQVLFEKAATEQVAPSSMSKIMTIYMVFEKLKRGDWTLETELPVSRKAWKTGGSKMFVLVDTTVSVQDLLRGAIVQSGNDACVVIAEAIGGTEAAFGDMMTERARELGLTQSVFKNSTGLPNPEHLSTAKDLSLIAQRLIEDFPEYYKMFAETSFTYSGVKQPNRNNLLHKGIGADGLKTGFTDAGGFGLVSSAIQEGRRLVLVVNGTESRRARTRESEALMRWGYAYFSSPTLFKKGDVVAPIDVWEGAAPTVDAVCTRDVAVSVPKKDMSKLKATVIYDSPVQAPIQAGQALGKVRFLLGDAVLAEVPMVAANDVEKAGMFKRMGQAFHYLIFGHNPAAEHQQPLKVQ
ncbi:MAG: D-alanyl-D-alanine carboxypeptidase [bacterium]|nr:D-alanyl-D-alanine carboxypeptidase [bacterium]